MDSDTVRLLQAMRAQLGESSASRTVDALATAEGLGMDGTTRDFDRRLNELVGAGYLEPDPNFAASDRRGMHRITFLGKDAADDR